MTVTTEAARLIDVVRLANGRPRSGERMVLATIRYLDKRPELWETLMQEVKQRAVQSAVEDYNNQARVEIKRAAAACRTPPDAMDKALEICAEARFECMEKWRFAEEGLTLGEMLPEQLAHYAEKDRRTGKGLLQNARFYEMILERTVEGILIGQQITNPELMDLWIAAQREIDEM